MLKKLKTRFLCDLLEPKEVIEFIFQNKEVNKIYFLSPVTYDLVRGARLMLEADLFLIDSLALAKLLGFKWNATIPRLSFDTASIAPLVFEYVSQAQLKVAVIGATEEENSEYCAQLVTRYQGLKLVYRRNGYFSDSALSGVISELQEARPDVIWVGMGAPRQENFCNQIIMMPGQKIFTCGGHISQSAKKWNFYPDKVEHTNLRWLYRLIYEPHARRRFHRVFSGLIRAYREA
ncbi:WecB/TagA/CpsF family glycosyltransferase [Oxalobacteraceae bacterium R-40]|uniref:WecB/TagA/CpsF family glycosyltransferase n=1 Tax=Keguizhuia sedimenti TaxID=3064264 RepID=A0ABU1BLM4_9BURK|nr:WecB/TagA/CpsF family glycosyltransferase [Oxalobacteraceae bacterium R-40]